MKQPRLEGRVTPTVVKPRPIFRPGEMGVVLEYTVRTPEGKVTEHKRMKSKSFVRAFLELLFVQMQMTSYNYPYAIRNTSNAMSNMSENYLAFSVGAAEGAAGNGVVVGSGVGAVDIDDYKLGTQISHGNTAGLLWYGAQTYGAPGAGALLSVFRMTRDFTNATAIGSPPGGNVTVNEVGVRCNSFDSGGTSRNFLIIRDVIALGIVVPTGQILTINYEEQVTL